MDFQAIAALALDRAPELLSQWIGGKRVGNEWHGERKANGGPGDSWSVNLTTGAWIHGASGRAGGDMVSLYAAYYEVRQTDAGTAIAPLVGYTNGNGTHHPVSGTETTSTQRRTTPDNLDNRQPSTVAPIPPDAIVPDHPTHGKPTSTYWYGRHFVVCRFDLPDKKVFTQLTWRANKWAWKSHPDPKPLFNVEQLTLRPDAPVLIVEGEKCAEAARLLKAYVVVTWAGGASAPKKSDWSPLANRDVLIWPDNDEPGLKAAAEIAKILLPLAKRLRVVKPTDTDPPGYDIADLLAATPDQNAAIAWARARVREVTKATPVAPAETAIPTVQEAPRAVQTSGLPSYDDYGSDSLYALYQQLKLDAPSTGTPFPTMANASKVVLFHPSLKAKVWFDEFRDRIYTSVWGAPRPWRDSDTHALLVFLQSGLGLHKMTVNTVHTAVDHAAMMNKRNPLTVWLDSLTWDQTPRLDTWLSDTLGVERNPYNDAISRNWPIAMVARAYRPGCKVDTMPVLEGRMGRGKSTFLETLGGEFYASLTQAFGSHEFIQAVQGNWLIEVPDMAGFRQRDTSMILSTITIRTDRYRASYGRFAADHPRKCMFAATSERDDYLKDPSGRRRYWPLRCTFIDVDVLTEQRDQLFAEAVVAFRQGQSWWEIDQELADAEQLRRIEEDPWAGRIHAYAGAHWQGYGDEDLTTSRLLEFAVEVPVRDQNHADKMRVASIMRANGWLQGRNMTLRYWYKPIRNN